MKSKLTIIAAALLSANSYAEQDTEVLERIVIEGQYLSVNESNSVKTPTPIIDVPQSLSIFTADDITSRGISSIGQIIDYTPGVNTSQGEGHRDAIVFRGIRSTADFFIDGNRDDVQYYRSLYNIEQVEILRGANALLFGRGGTGGILNRVTKKPVFGQQFNGFKTGINTFGGYDLSVDSNFSTGKTSAVRINAMYESLDNHRDFYDGDRYGFNPTARFDLGDDTVLDVSYEYINHERFIDRGIPTAGDSIGRPVEAFEDIVFADPENNYNDLEAHVFRIALEHQFNAYLKGNFGAFYGDYEKIYANFYPSNFFPDTNIVELDGYIDTTERENIILSGNLVAEFSTGGLEHTLIFGGEIINTSSDQDRLNPVFDTRVANPSRGGTDRETFTVARPISFSGFTGINSFGENTSTGFTSLNDDTRVDLDVYSFYIQDEIALSEKFDIVLGARFDSFDIEVFNANPTVLETRTRKDEEVSPRAGFIYKPAENISIYASYSESFLPRSGEQFSDINGDRNRLDPDTFESKEIGIKWDFAGGLSITAALFENEQTSLDVSDADSSILEEIDSDISGFEIQLKGQITDDWSINANYSNLDGENGSTGLDPRELPENTFSIWSTYRVNDVFGFGVGATYQDESFINNGNTAILPSYTRVDAAAYYEVSDELTVQLNIENLTDKLYFPNAHATHQATVGAPINARLSLIGKF